jgi:hypothetical protein
MAKITANVAKVRGTFNVDRVTSRAMHSPTAIPTLIALMFLKIMSFFSSCYNEVLAREPQVGSW